MKLPQPPHPNQTQNMVYLGVKIIAVLISTLAIFYQDLVVVGNNALQNEFTSHILALPFLLIYLFYRKRKTTRAVITLKSESSWKILRRSEIVGTLLFLITFLLYSFGSYTFTPLEYHLLALPIFVTACILILFNGQTLKQLAFPIMFLFFLVPPPSEIVYGLGAILSKASTEVACGILKFFGFPASISMKYANPIIMVTQTNGTTLSFVVDIACSGIYSLIGFTIFATFIVYIARGRTWKKATLLIIGFALIYLLNILRITIIVLIGYHYGMELAMNVFHLLGGWVLIFLGTLLLLAVSERILKIQLFTKKKVVPCPKCDRNSASEERNFCQECGRLLKHFDIKLKNRDLAKLFAVLLGVVLVISVQAPVFALTKGPVDILTQIAEGRKPTTEILPQMQGYALKFVYRDKEFEKIATQDAALAYAYLPSTNYGNPIWVAIEIASARSSLHRWETCLITFPTRHGEESEVTQLDLRDVQLIDNPPIIARYFAFQYGKNNLTQVILYWFEEVTFSTNSTFQQKHVKIGLMAYPIEVQELEEVEDELLIFGRAVANYWQPLKTWSPIALLISQNGNNLTTIPAAAIGAVLMVNFVNKKRERNSNKKVLKKLSTQDQQIIEATHQTQNRPVSNVCNIASTFHALNGKKIETQGLIYRLNSLKQIGIVREEIVNKQDEPTLVWKAQI